MKLLLVILAVIGFLALEIDTASLERIRSSLKGHSRTRTKDLPKNFTIQQRTYNGVPANKREFPYIVYLSITLNNGDDYSCGGSIIDNSWILTAAHCTEVAEYIEIFYGSTKPGVGIISHKVGASNIIQHEDYDNESLENDVALIHTPHVEFTKLIDKVQLADRDNDYEGYWSVVSGWGDINDEGDSPDELLYANLQILEKDAYEEQADPDIVLCATSSEGVNIGKGDSGGPLVTFEDHKLVGVTSFNFEFNALPACFSRVSAFRDWIDENTDIE
ncbi:serine protease 1-like [Drosophila innubila]|uniref:serine protease 1-like n=1 Tax=Drosophila innubila TaxID=198719 RepID=UPI00148DD45E|nr:serine protease 1-like [Drosophila innubila]